MYFIHQFRLISGLGFPRLPVVLLLISLSGCSPPGEYPDTESTEKPVPTPVSVEIVDSEVSFASVSTATTPTELSKGWDELPELPIQEPRPPESLPPVPTSVPEPSEVPAHEPTGPVIPGPNAIWMAGVIDGGPPDLEVDGDPDADAMIPGADSVLHITNPAELPSYIAPGQRLVLHLPGFPPGSYLVSVATTGGSSETLKEEYLDLEKFFHRSLTVRWNDHLIWQRWVPPVFSIALAALPPLSLSAESNLLVLENSGTQVLPLNAVWVEAVPDKGEPFYVSLEDAHWLNRADSAWVRNTRLTLTLPAVEADWELPMSVRISSPPKNVGELPDAWQETLNRYRRLGEESPEKGSGRDI